MSETITPTPPDSLIQYQGRPVPWVTRWSGEVNEEPYSLSIISGPKLRVGYKTGVENREESGLLWQKEGINRAGEPQYSQINTYRQRMCMAKTLCQVCGKRINDHPIEWLMPRESLDLSDDGALTFSPPTCAACIPTALSLCPYLKTHEWIVAMVLDYGLWGVYGGVAVIDQEGGSQLSKGAWVPYGDPSINMHAVIAKQSVARLNKYVLKELE